MIKKLLRDIGLWPYLKYFRKKYFPSASQQADNKLIPERIDFYRQFIKQGDLCFDIGANIGNRTEVFFRIGARVVAVEPQQECTKLLQIRFGKKIKLIKSALGEKEGEGTIYVSETSEISSLSKDWIQAVSESRFKGIQWNKTEKIAITTLDKLISTFGTPKFCKIDVEGFEEEVLKGLSRPIPVISFEYTIPERLVNIKNILDQLSQLGKFECNYTLGEVMKLEFENWLSKEELLNQFNELAQTLLFGDIYIRFIINE